MIFRPFFHVAAGLAAILTISCNKAPQDPLCKSEPLPSGFSVHSGEGAVRISAPTDEYFYANDETGKQIGHAHLNAALALKSGDYDVTLNGSHHTVHVPGNLLTTCAAGIAITKGDTDEYYYVSDSAGSEIAHKHLGSSLAFFPGVYKVKVNNSTANIQVQPGAVSEVQTATLTVPGSTDEYYYVFDQAGTELAHNHLGRPLAFLPGSRNVKVNNSAAPVSMAVGSPAEVKTGSLLVHGTTDEYYYVYNPLGTELAHQHLNAGLSFIPGAYTVKVNHSDISTNVQAGVTAEYQTGTLTVNGGADAYYYVHDKNGAELGHNHLNSSLALPEGSYTVKLGNDERPVSLQAAKVTIVKW